jgi:hypothetical protein
LSLFFYLFFGLIGLLLMLFAWSVRKPRRHASPFSRAGTPDESGRRHMTYLPQIRQALAKTDYEFLSKRASRELLRRVRRERRRVALAYLAALRVDFQSLLRMARVIAALSPEVAAVHEFERLRLTAKFAWQFEMIRWKLLAGLAPVPQLDGLSDLVSGLSVRMETAMKELGERAAAAAKLASSIDRRGLDVA